MNIPDFDIRAIEEKDLPAVHELVVQLAIYEKEPQAVVTSPEEYLEDFRNNLFEGHVAVTGSTVIGMSVFYMTYSTWKGKMLYLEDFYVIPEARKMGVGQALFSAFLDEARKQGCRLVKWQVLDWNEPAIQFYKKNGATLETEWWNGKVFFDSRES